MKAIQQRKEKKMREFMVQVCKWRDRVNGNTYHNVIVILGDHHYLRSGFKYGYGNQYKETAMKLIKEEYPDIEIEQEQIITVWEGWVTSKKACKDFRGVLMYE